MLNIFVAGLSIPDPKRPRILNGALVIKSNVSKTYFLYKQMFFGLSLVV